MSFNVTPFSGAIFTGNAADIPFTPVGTVAATDVQAAIAETASEGGVGTNVDIEFPGQYGGYENKGNCTGAVTVDWDAGNMQRLRLTGNVTLTFTNPTAGRRYLLIIEQDGTGSRTVTWPTMRWFAGIVPTLSTSATAVDQVSINYTVTNAGNEYVAAASIGY